MLWRGAAMSLWSTFFGVSFALFALVAIPLADGQGLATIFHMHGIMMIITATALLLFLGDIGPPQPVDPAAKSQFLSAYRQWPMVWPGIGWLFYTLTFVSMLAILPDLFDSDMRGPTTTAMPIISIVVSMVAVPALLLRVSATTVVMGGFMLCAAAIALNTAFALPTMAIALFGALGLVQGATFAAVAELNSSTADRALGYGILAQTGNIGNLLGTPLFLVVLGVGGIDTMLIAVFCTYAIGAVCLLLTSNRLKSRSD